jgi:hypothetical protein
MVIVFGPKSSFNHLAATLWEASFLVIVFGPKSSFAQVRILRFPLITV